MATSVPDTAGKDGYTTHEERTGTSTRAKDIQTAIITSIKQATSDVRLIDFEVRPMEPFRFKAGQWVDCFTPASEQAGGFTIVSTPSEGLEGRFRLAIQKAERNPPAKWLWRPQKELENEQTVDVRIGGQFTFPPVNFRRLAGKVQSVTFLCAGIGINPMISILGAIRDARAPLKVSMLYGFREPSEALFLEELRELQSTTGQGISLDLSVYISGKQHDAQGVSGSVHNRRMSDDDVLGTIDQSDKASKLYYICGPSEFTDHMQELLLNAGVEKDVVQTERWW